MVQVKHHEINVAARIPLELYKALDLIRADRQIRTNKTTTLSEIIREALAKYSGTHEQAIRNNYTDR